MAGPAGKKRSKTIRPKFNTFSLLDHLSGRYVKGRDGLWYLNGGYPHVIGFAGRGNTFKSALSGTLATIISLRYKFEYTEFNDTEMSMQPSRIQDYIDSVVRSHHWDVIPNIEELMENEKTTWNFTASDEQTGDEWWKTNCRDEVAQRRKLSGKALRVTPFKNIDGTYVSMPNPWSFTVDSLSELHTNAAAKKIDKANLGESELNTSFMDDARHKAQLMGQMPQVAAQGNFYFGLVAHADDELKMDMYAPSTKKLDGLKGNLKLKGVPGRGFTFLTNSCLLAVAINNGLNKSDKMPEYPHPDSSPKVGDTDIRIIKYIELRGKSGPTGAEIDMVFSQREGFLPGVTEYVYIKEVCKEFGIIASGVGGSTKQLMLYPDVKFTRKTLRKVLQDDVKFTRALSITASLSYMYHNWFDLEPEYIIEPDQLVKMITDNGFDWNEILEGTVDYWYFEDQTKEVGKSTITAKTLLEMALGKLKPKVLKCSK